MDVLFLFSQKKKYQKEPNDSELINSAKNKPQLIKVATASCSVKGCAKAIPVLPEQANAAVFGEVKAVLFLAADFSIEDCHAIACDDGLQANTILPSTDPSHHHLKL